ncbi:MAG: SMP-30/gluconolactonase/LRE family protein [Isosphaeraceae bacterium]
MTFTAFLTLLMIGQVPILTTTAGTGEPGDSGDGGPATAARLNGPFDLAFDRQGNLFFSDTGNHKIRRIDARTGTITTIAGDGTKGFAGDGGPATRARLDEPYGLAIDDEGRLYFADRLNRRVRRVDAGDGSIRTVAGNGGTRYEGDGGPADATALVEPNGVAWDPAGRLFIADVADHRVRVVDLKTGRIATFAGDGRGKHSGDGGPASAASLFGARAVKVGPSVTVFIVERQGNSLRRVDREGIITTIAGTGKKGYTGDGGPAIEATMDGPKELAVATDGRVAIVDTENHAIRLVQDGRIATVAGCGRKGAGGDGGPAVAASLDRPHGVAFGPDGSLYIGDTGNHRIRKVERP